jgi:lysophospholipase L1-like esterase
MKCKVMAAIVLAWIFVSGDIFAQQFRIMPLGNSITTGRQNRGAIDWGGYRDDLAEMLVGEDIDFDMVGSQNDGTDYYPRHEGHPGWNSYQIADNVAGWLDLYYPNVVFLEIGTNDVSNEWSVSYIISEIENIVDEINYYDSGTILFLASVIPRIDSKDALNDDLNDAIRDLINSKKVQGYRIFYSAQNERFQENTNWATEYMSDYLHPNDAGYHVMADQFFEDFMANINPNTDFTIAGNIHYYSNDDPVSDVFMNVSEDSTIYVVTNAAGNYEFVNLSTENDYTINPHKPTFSTTENSTDFIITTYCAALTLRQSVGLENLTAHQRTAADVDLDGHIFSYDAAMIARYAVGLPPNNDSHVGEWLFTPESRAYLAPNYDKTTENYTAILLGDVSGNFASAPKMLTKQESTESEQLTCGYRSGDVFNLSVNISQSGLLAIDVIANIPENYLRFREVTQLEPTAQFQKIENIADRTLRIGFYDSEPTNQIGDLVVLAFDVLQPFATLEIEKNTKLYDRSAVISYNVLVNEINCPSTFVVYPNYPNPFNPATTISYEIPEQGDVSVNIYNMLGQHVKSLFDGTQFAGLNRLQWNGDTDTGQPVSAGAYLCQIRYNGNLKVIRMVKMD